MSEVLQDSGYVVRMFVLFLFFLFASFYLFAEDNTDSLLYKWEHPDASNVKFYRYQLDGEHSDEWTIVPGDITSTYLENTEPGVEHKLYVQASYDGVNWSESGSASGAVEIRYVPVAEEAIPPEEPYVSDYVYKTNILILAGVANDINFKQFSFNVFPKTGIAFDFQNIVHAGQWGMGLRLDLNTIIEPYEQDWSLSRSFPFWFDNSADLKLMMYLGNSSFDFFFGGGAGYSLINPSLRDDFKSPYAHSLGDWGRFSSAWFVSANLGFRYRFNSFLSLGLEANVRYLMPTTDKMWMGSVDAVVGVSF